MRRREFLTLAGAVAMLPRITWAQQPASQKKIAVLDPTAADDPVVPPRYAALEGALAKLGWVKEVNFTYDRIWLGGDLSLAQSAARELISRRPDVIYVNGGGPLAAVADMTKTIPVVFNSINDPVGQGLAQSLSRPGGNLTGVSIFDPLVIGKWVGLLVEIAPQLKRVVFWGNPLDSNFAFLTRWLEDPSRRFSVPVTAVGANSLIDVEALFARLSQQMDAGLILVGGAFEGANRKAIVDLTLRYRLATMSQNVLNVEMGGLIGYGFDSTETWAAAAGAIDQILRGTDPAVIPIVVPQSYTLAINAKTAETLGLGIPPLLFAAADQVFG